MSGKTVSQIVAGAAVEPNPIAFFPSDNPEAVVFNLNQPFRANGRLMRGHRKAWRDETRRRGPKRDDIRR